jgi:U-box domain
VPHVTLHPGTLSLPLSPRPLRPFIMTILVDKSSNSSSNNIEPKGEAEEATETTELDDNDEEMAMYTLEREFDCRKSRALVAANKVKSSSGDQQPLSSPPLSSTEPAVDCFTALHGSVDSDPERMTDTLGIPNGILKDPLTNTRMVDPVVNPAGDSYERSSLLLTDERIEFYPNRALQAILKHQDDYETQQATESANNSAVATCCCWWYHDVHTKGTQLPEAFYCPITCDIMVDPWIGPDGCTYEYDGIRAWLEQCHTEPCSPVTRQPLCLGQFRPNNALYDLIQWETQLPLLQRHDSMQKWMNSTRTTTTRSPRLNHPPPIVVPPPRASAAAATVTGSNAAGATTSNPLSDSTRTTSAVEAAATNDTRSKKCCKFLYTCLGIVLLFLVAYLVFPLSFAVASVVAALIFLACHCGTACDE